MVVLEPVQSSMINNGNFLRFINTFDEGVMLENRQFGGPRPMGIAQGLSQGGYGGGGGGGDGGGDLTSLDFISNPDTARFLFVMFVMQVCQFSS